MSNQIPDPSKRSFLYQLVESFFDVLRAWKALQADWKMPPSPSEKHVETRAEQTELEESIRQLQQLPPAHLIFLLTFDPPRPRAAHPKLPAFLPYQHWEAFLGVNPNEVVQALQALGALIRSELRTHLEHKFNRDELQTMLKAHGLPVSGNKSELAERLAQADAQAMWATLADLTLLECTPWASQTAQRSLMQVERTEVAAESTAEHGTTAGYLRAAIQWALAAAAAGLIGNRADDVVLALVERVTGTPEGGTDDTPAPVSPTPPATTADAPAAPDQPVPQPVPTPEEPHPHSTPTPPNTRFASRSPIDFDWVTIPAGAFLMGSDKSKDKDVWDDELPQHRFYLPEYRVARAPVTNAQFRPFVAAKGYTTESFWSTAGWQWRTQNKITEPRYWQDSQWNSAEQPVVGVSWYEASAYANWLAQATGTAIRLPTEADWGKRPRGTDGRIYPWGNQPPDKELCNFNSHVGKTTAVDAYPKGASPYGVLDMAGNVWEWTATKWVDNYANYANVVDNDPTGGAGTGALRARVVRGGSCYNSPNSVRAAYRDWRTPDFRINFLGFRLVVAVAPR